MPAIYAHYVFGKKVYAILPRSEKEIIRKGKDAFLLGLHGPDLLFYYYPIGKNRINQQGTRMHKELAADFFEKGRIQYQSEKDPVLRAYLYGFLCHFILDSECHPYINCYMEEQKLGHLEIETELDRYLMELDGLNPLVHIPIHHLISRSHTRKVIAGMFEHVTEAQIHTCIRMFRMIITFFVCRNPWKRYAMRKMSGIMGQDAGIGGLIMHGQVHPRCADSDLFLEERLERSVKLAAEEIGHYSQVLEGQGLLSARLYRNYEEYI